MAQVAGIGAAGPASVFGDVAVGSNVPDAVFVAGVAGIATEDVVVAATGVAAHDATQMQPRAVLSAWIVDNGMVLWEAGRLRKEQVVAEAADDAEGHAVDIATVGWIATVLGVAGALLDFDFDNVNEIVDPVDNSAVEAGLKQMQLAWLVLDTVAKVVVVVREFALALDNVRRRNIPVVCGVATP